VKSVPEEEMAGSKQSVEEEIVNLQSEKSTIIEEAEPVDSGDPESVARSVCQALQSGQVSLVGKIVSTSSFSQDIIQKTVTLLPAESVLPLLAVLQSKFENGCVVELSHALWLRSVLTGHAGYLMSLPDCHHVLSSLHTMMAPKTKHFATTQHLAGKLEMLDKQIKEKSRSEAGGAKQEKSLLSYQDDSSDELEDVIDDLLVPGSDTDDDWEEEDNYDEKNNESDDSIEVVEDNNESENDDNDVKSMSDSD